MTYIVCIWYELKVDLEKISWLLAWLHFRAAAQYISAKPLFWGWTENEVRFGRFLANTFCGLGTKIEYIYNLPKKKSLK